jgi:hypothetical protein
MLTLLVALTLQQASLCDGMDEDFDLAPCQRLVRAHTFQPAAARVCLELESSHQRLRCLNAIADRDYPQGVNACARLDFGPDIIDCFATSGRLVEAPEPRARVVMARGTTPVTPRGPSITLENASHDPLLGVAIATRAGGPYRRVIGRVEAGERVTLPVQPGRLFVCVDHDSQQMSSYERTVTDTLRLRVIDPSPSAVRSICPLEGEVGRSIPVWFDNRSSFTARSVWWREPGSDWKAFGHPELAPGRNVTYAVWERRSYDFCIDLDGGRYVAMLAPNLVRFERFPFRDEDARPGRCGTHVPR